MRRRAGTEKAGSSPLNHWIFFVVLFPPVIAWLICGVVSIALAGSILRIWKISKDADDIISGRLDRLIKQQGDTLNLIESVVKEQDKLRQALMEMVTLTSENIGLRLEKQSERIIALETERDVTKVLDEGDDDPLGGAGSWLSQQHAAEVAQGVRVGSPRRRRG